ncbi:MAG: hypothetical protein DRJ96_08965 [Thermoprotei archaeon]|nr:MAG: hypothetical protein DRJ67_12385 [Thermoprotei archaeon]RLE95142.1 MAG: hypothetical protein DRJ96_08965 [Thermoprotei archaeon]
MKARLAVPAAIAAVNAALLNPWGLAASIAAAAASLRGPGWLYYALTALAAVATLASPNLWLLRFCGL